jgi:hypothetical protein
MAQYEANVEFLGFLAHVTDPGTGEIVPARLGCWLGLSGSDLQHRWRSSGHDDWRDFANDVLSVLDAMQDLTESLAVTLLWFRHLPIAQGEGCSADGLVAAGNVRRAMALVRLVERQGKAYLCDLLHTPPDPVQLRTGTSS